VDAWHELLMVRQERNLQIVTQSATEVFIVETVVQFWQARDIDSRQLVVYCGCPTLMPENESNGLELFDGYLEASCGRLPRSSDGCLRGDPNLLDDVSRVGCDGWQGVSVTALGLAREVYHAAQPIAIARLSAPMIELALVAGCCGAKLSGATVSVDGEAVGTTLPEQSLRCRLHRGEHTLHVEHMLLTEALRSPFRITCGTNSRVNAQVSSRRLRFVCVETPSGGSSSSSADLWLVGGKPEDWVGALEGAGLKTWLWDGELGGRSVKAGALAEAATQSIVGECPLTRELTTPRSDGTWQVVLHREKGLGVCSMAHLASMKPGESALWLARLSPAAKAAKKHKQLPHRSVLLRSACCGQGLRGMKIVAAGRGQGESDSGCFELLLPTLPQPTDQVEIRIVGAPPCLLPGGTCRYAMPLGSPSQVKTMELQVSCLLWVYWLPPPADDDFADGPVFVTSDPTHVPFEAAPVAGTLVCSYCQDGELALDGSTTGPFAVRASQECFSEIDAQAAGPCLLAQTVFDLESPTGFSFSANDKYPLAQIGDCSCCKLESLVKSAVCIGSFKTLPPPLPRQVSLRTPCCGQGFACARVGVDGVEAAPVESMPGYFDVRRRRREDREGQLRIRVDGIPTQMLPAAQNECEICYGASEPEVAELGITCALWFYWIPPDFDSDDDPLDGMIFVAAKATDVPDDAKAVTGIVEFPGGEPVTLSGNSIGPFEMRGLSAAGPDGLCAVSQFVFSLATPEGFDCKIREPSPLAERCADLGGCELQRLLDCPVAIGYFRAHSPPALTLSLCSECCGSAWVGATISIDGHSPTAFDDEGCVSLQRLRRGGECQIQVHGVLPCLLPFRDRTALSYGPVEPDQISLLVSCSVWVYLIDGGDKDDEDDGFTVNPGIVFIAADPDQIPEEALPVTGKILCSEAACETTPLDGSSIGPFSFQAHPEATDGRCLLADLEFFFSAPNGFEYVPKKSPLQERFLELGGCELHRLVSCPVAIGCFSPLPEPLPRVLSLRTCCCGEPFAGASAVVDGREPKLFDDAGCLRLQRRPLGDRSGTFVVSVGGVPSHLFDSPCEIEYGEEEAKCKELDVQCLLWTYWVPPPEDDGDDEEMDGEDEERLPLNAMVFVAADPSHIPDEAQPIVGSLDCRFLEGRRIVINGSSMGPFALRRAASDDADDDAIPCIASGVTLEVNPPEGFEYCAKDPSPFAERCAELGGCEYQRILACPQVVGSLVPIPPPPLHIELLTTCCRSCFEGAGAAINGKDVELAGMDGVLPVKKRKRAGELALRVNNVPAHLLRGGSCEINEEYGPNDTLVHIDVECNLWFYWTPPDQEEMEWFMAGDVDEAPEGMVFVAASPDQVPEDAKPIAGSVECPNTPGISLDGASIGPFIIRAGPTSPSGNQRCALGQLQLRTDGPEGFTYRAKYPSPLAERSEELGGCELQRLIGCPTALGFLKPVA
jgi:hypothetical protein